MAAGLRPTPKGVDGSQNPTVSVAVLDLSDERALGILDCYGPW